MAARAAKIRGGKVEIRKEHIEIYKITHFQNSRKTFQVKLPNDCTIIEVVNLCCLVAMYICYKFCIN
jgi:hypothetical protein